jgi:hypothetical protein
MAVKRLFPPALRIPILLRFKRRYEFRFELVEDLAGAAVAGAEEAAEAESQGLQQRLLRCVRR